VSASPEQKARDEAMFRDVNDTFVERQPVALDAPYLVYCECPDEACVEEIVLTVGTYERVRSQPRWFVVKPGHCEPDVERVVEAHDDYWIVEKHGVAGEVAEETDPRG